MMIDIINKSWAWTGVIACFIIDTNDFGNIIFKAEDGKYWRICPEELNCKVIAEDKAEFEQLQKDDKFIEDWKMKNLVDSARAELDMLEEGENYCLKLPAVFGGLYDSSNLGKISHTDQIRISGELGFQIKDFPDGQKIDLSL